MDDNRASADKLSTDEEQTVGLAKHIDLANNVQARYASPHRPSALIFTFEGSKTLFEISLSLRC